MKPSTYIIATIWICLVLTLFIGQASAWTDATFVADTQKTIDLNSKANFGVYTITYHKWWDILKIWTEETIKTIVLESNTDGCGQNCKAQMRFNLLKDGVLIEDSKFLDVEDKMKETTIRSSSVWIWDNPKTGTESYLDNVCTYTEEGEKESCSNVLKERSYYYKLVDDYKYVCEKTGELSKNGTAIEECRNEVVGQKEYRYDGWVQYNIGDKVVAGEYLVEFRGNKPFDKEIDWQVKVDGVWTSAWAIWGVSDMTNGLVAQYRANTQNFTLNNQTQVLDTLGLNNGTLSGRTFNDGTASGGVTIEDGAMKFDGVNGYVSKEMSFNLTNTSDYTFVSWVKVNELPPATFQNALFGFRKTTITNLRGITLGLSDSGFFNFIVRTDAGANTASTISALDTDFMLVGIYDYTNSRLKLYKDGVLVSNVSLTQLIPDDTRFMQFGERGIYGNSDFFNGTIYQNLLFNRALSQAEITQLYNQGRGQYSSVTNGLVAQYSGRDYKNSTAYPKVIYDTNHLGDGKVLESLSFDGVDDYVDTGITTRGSNFSISLWFNTNQLGVEDWFLTKWNNIGDKREFAMRTSSTNKFSIQTSPDGTSAGNTILLSETTFTIGEWLNPIITYDGSNLRLYVNGELEDNESSVTINEGDYQILLGKASFGSSFNGSLDDVRIYNRTLSEDEIAYLYNSGMGREDSSDAWIEVNSPFDDQVIYTNQVTTNATAYVESGAYLVNATLYDNSTGTWGARNTTTYEAYDNFDDSVVNQTKWENSSYKADYGVQGWVSENNVRQQIGCDSGGGASSPGTSWALSASKLLWDKEHYMVEFGTITIQNNNGNTQARVRIGTTTAFQLTSAGTYTGYKLEMQKTSPSNVQYRVYNGTTWTNWNNTALAQIDFYSYCFHTGSTAYYARVYLDVNYVGGNYQTQTQTFTNTYSAGSNTLWNMQFCDSDGDCGFATSNYTFSIDSTAPTINLSYPTALIDYGKLNGTLELNFTATDTNLDKVWYNYNGTNITIAGAVSGVYNQSNITLSTKKNVTIYANDTAGNIASEVFSWDYKVFETARNYSTTSSTTTLETFSINFTTNTAVLPVVYLEYDGTEYLSTRTGTTTNHYAVNEISISEAGTKQFRWKITYDANTIYTDYSTQTVSNVSSLTFVTGACGAGLTKVMNFTFADEQNLTALENVTARFNFQYGVTDSSGSTAYGTVSNTAQVSLCINTSTSPTYEIGYGEVEYEKTDYATRRFYVFDTTRVNNTTVNTVLYMLPSAQSTSFLIEVRSPTLSPYAGVYTSLLRWYPAENEYRVVEMGKTDDKGQTVKKIKIEDVDYRVGIYFTNGSLIHMINPIRMVCLATPCSYTINIPTTSTNQFDEVYGIEAVIVYSAGVFILTYNDPSQNTEIMSLQVYKIGGTTNNLVCESNGTSFTGILTCNVSTESGTLKAIAVRTASPDRPIAMLIVDTLTTVFTGTFGLFLQFMIVVTLAFLGIVSPVVAIIMAVIALLFGVLLFKTMTYPMLVGIALLGGIVIHLMKRQ